MSTEADSSNGRPTASLPSAGSGQAIPEFILQQTARYQRDPELAHYWDARPYGGYEKTPSLLLKTRGRKTGQLRTRPLIYARDGERYVVIGSRGSGSQDPSWVLNVEASPNVDVQVVHDHFPALATFAAGAERGRLWDLMVELFPPYVEYQRCSEREIPIVVLTPCGPARRAT